MLNATRALCVTLPLWLLLVGLAQDEVEISAENLQQLAPAARIDFHELEGEFQSGWFTANDSASEFIIVDANQRIHRVNAASQSEQLSFLDRREGQVFAVLDAAFVGDEPFVMTSYDGAVFVNQHPLVESDEFLAMFAGVADADLFVEAMDDDGAPVFLRYLLSSDQRDLAFVERIPLPASNEAPVMRVGRVPFPIVILSSLADGALSVYSFPSRFSSTTAAQYTLNDGPAVNGALNGPAASHFAWIDPLSARLNLLDLNTGESRVIDRLGGAYAQYLLLSHDASAILAVNLDFIPRVFAWNAHSGEQLDLGPYRECGRIPDKVRLSRDGSSLIIGCDSGLDIWRITDKRRLTDDA